MSVGGTKLPGPTIPGTNLRDPTRSVMGQITVDRCTSMVAVTAAVLAALATISSMLSSNHLNAAMIEQIEASNQWTYFQAEGIKKAVLEGKVELLPSLAQPARGADQANLARYKSEQDVIGTQAKGHQAAAQDHRRRHQWMSRAATAFQVSIALCAVAPHQESLGLDHRHRGAHGRRGRDDRRPLARRLIASTNAGAAPAPDPPVSMPPTRRASESARRRTRGC